MDENEKQQNNDEIKVLRTYTSDMAEAVKKNEISVIKIAMAEKEKKEKELEYTEVDETTTSSKKLPIIGGIILIITAIIGSYFLLKNKSATEIPTQQTTNIETLIAYDSKEFLDVTNITNVFDLSEIIKKENPSDPGPIKAFFLTRKINNLDEMLTSKNFLSLIKATTPSTLIRSLTDKYLLGKYLIQNNKSAIFLIFQTTDYPQAYSSMLEWEKTMFQDLTILFDINDQEQGNQLSEKKWKDVVIKNKDARVLYNNNGEEILYYVFVNKNNFVITNNLNALKEVLARLLIKNQKPL
jgi:hypothetical protein